MIAMGLKDRLIQSHDTNVVKRQNLTYGLQGTELLKPDRAMPTKGSFLPDCGFCASQ